MKELIALFLFFFISISPAYLQDCNYECDNLILNSTLDLTEEGENIPLGNAFFNDFVSPWYSTINSPHLAYDNGTVNCFFGGYDPDPTNPSFNCIYSTWINDGTSDKGYAEEIAQDIDFIANGYNSYCVDVSMHTLDCTVFPELIGRIVLRAGTDVETYDYNYYDFPPTLPGGDSEIIDIVDVPTSGIVTSNTIFEPDFNHTTFRIANAIGAGPYGISYVSIDQVSITCKTTSITDIETSIMDNVVDFTAINGSTFDYTSYLWTFDDGSISTEPTPTHTYYETGSYEVCLEIVDENGCCGTHCKEIEVVSSYTCEIDDETIVIGTSDLSINSFSDLLSSGVINSGGTVTGQDFVVKGKLILDENATFSGCTFNFEPGASLDIKSPGYIRIVNSFFMGCSEMWRGISVYGTSAENVVWFGGNYISDAYRGLTILEESNIQQFANTFDANYVGIYSPPNNGVMKTHYGSSITRSTFKSEKEMLPPYPYQGGWSEIAEYGIQVYDLDRLFVTEFNTQIGGPGPTPTYRNRFEGIKSGISSKNTNLRVTGNEFRNLQHPNSGWAIVGETFNNCNIKYNEFLNVNYGISLKNTENAILSIIANRFIEDGDAIPMPTYQVSRRINIYDIHSSRFAIYSNELSQERILGSGISIISCNSSNGIHVMNNKLYSPIRSLNISLNNVHKVEGAEGIISGNHNYDGSGNINFESRILLQNTDNFVVSNNRLKSKSSYASPFGFYNSTRCLIEGNESTLHTTNINSTNYYVSNCPGNIYCCNEANNGQRGFYFRGENKKTELRSSLFYDVNYGLFLYNAEIDDQDLYGNYWENQSSDTKARFINDLGEDDAYESSIIRINPGQQGTRPLNVLPLDWFMNVGGQAYVCPENNQDETCDSDNWDGFNFTGTIPNGDPCDLFKNELIELVGPEVYWHFQNQNDWVFYSYVFDNYKDIPLEFWSDCFPIPEKEVNVKTIAEYYHVDKSYKEAFRPNVNEALQLDMLHSELENDMDDLIGLLENIETEADYQAIKADFIVLQQHYFDINTDINIIKSGISSRGNSVLQGLGVRINNLASDFYFLDDLKFLWNIRNQVDLYSVESVSSAQWNEIDRLSLECDIEYGSIVFEAQALMGLNGVTEFDTENSCERQVPRTNGNNEELIHVFPNPSNGLYTIDCSENIPSFGSVNVYDVSGRKVFSKKIIGNEAIINIDLSDKANGVYILKLIKNEGVIHQEKLVVLK